MVSKKVNFCLSRERRPYSGPTCTREDAAEGHGFPSTCQKVKFSGWWSITLASTSAGHPTAPLLTSPSLSWKVVFLRLGGLSWKVVFLRLGRLSWKVFFPKTWKVDFNIFPFSQLSVFAFPIDMFKYFKISLYAHRRTSRCNAVRCISPSPPAPSSSPRPSPPPPPISPSPPFLSLDCSHSLRPPFLPPIPRPAPCLAILRFNSQFPHLLLLRLPRTTLLKMLNSPSQKYLQHQSQRDCS